MSRKAIMVMAAIGAAALLVMGAAAAYVLRTPAAQSGELTAIPLATFTATPLNTVPAPELETTGEGLILADLLQAESEARFIVNEVLDNQPNTVVGSTNQVAAQISIDPRNPANVQLGVVKVDMRALATDNSMRNRAIQNFVLETGRFEFVTFTPNQLIGLPVSARIGEPFSFQILGDLTIRDVTRAVTFDVTVTVESESRLSGLASAAILRSNFGLNIPSVPRVASVEDEVRLELQFVAAPTN